MRSIASEESVVAPAAQVSFGWKHEYPAETFGHTANRTTKEDSSVDVEKSVGLAKRGAIGIVLSNTVVCRSDDPRIGQMTKICSFEESVTQAKPEKIAVSLSNAKITQKMVDQPFKSRATHHVACTNCVLRGAALQVVLAKLRHLRHTQRSSGVQITVLSRRGQNPEKSLNFFSSNRLVFLSRKPSNTLESPLTGAKMRML